MTGCSSPLEGSQRLRRGPGDHVQHPLLITPGGRDPHGLESSTLGVACCLSGHLCGWRWWEQIWERGGAVGLGQMRAAVAVSGVKRALSCGNSSEVERFGGDVRCSHRGGQGFKSPQLHRRSEAGSDSRNRPLALSGVRFGSGFGSRVRTPCCEEEEAGASLPLGGPGHSASLRPSTTELPMR